MAGSQAGLASGGPPDPAAADGSAAPRSDPAAGAHQIVAPLHNAAAPVLTAGLTICSVAFRSQKLLDANHELVSRLNPPGAVDRWIVVENTPADEPLRLSKMDQRFDLLLGVKRPQVEDGFASLQHGKALNRALEAVKTRFVLFLDPDFFVVRRGWVQDVLAHMLERGLSFFGAPWHPRWYRKWRHFPCAHCLFIDLQRVEREAVDFTPDLSRQPLAYVSPFLTELEWMFCRRENWKAWWTALKHWRLALQEDRRRRLVIGSTRDTGVAVYERFSARPDTRHETLVPVYVPYQDRLVPPPDVRLDTRSPLREALEVLRPDWLSFIPKRRRSYSRQGFAALGLPDLHGRGWEEFLWQGEPFGFHVRNTLRAMQDAPVEVSEIRDVVQKVVGPNDSSR